VEPDSQRQHIFDSYPEAMDAWMLLPEEVQEVVAPPRQSIDCWIFDKE
jgi:hypothetical protein